MGVLLALGGVYANYVGHLDIWGGGGGGGGFRGMLDCTGLFPTILSTLFKPTKSWEWDGGCSETS